MEKMPSMNSPKKPYEAPSVVELGSLHGLTLQLKNGARCDVTCFHHGSLSPE